MKQITKNKTRASAFKKRVFIRNPGYEKIITEIKNSIDEGNF